MRTIDKLKILAGLALGTKGPKIFSFHDCLPDVFSGYLELLAYKRYSILGGQELLERFSSKVLDLDKEPHVNVKEAVLTFDDGRRNCWSVIFPLLKKYRAKAILFVIPSRISEVDEYFPNLEDYWNGRTSWENLYLSHRRMPYLTWKELEIMQSSGLVEIHSHGLRHDVVRVSSGVIDFQHPGVYEMPVYFDEWFDAGLPLLDYQWGAPIYERSWAPFASNIYVPDRRADTVMNEFVKNNGGFLFFKKKKWRAKLFNYYNSQKKNFGSGHFKKIEDREDAYLSLAESKSAIEKKMGNKDIFFSLPLYQSSPEILKIAADVGYRAIFTGPQSINKGCKSLSLKADALFILTRIPSFWIKFLAYL
ncbi:MAG TPA: hypothetical protein DCL35_06445 [Candidatus Omnitrophica bacterium]|nr:hypothetical protein [Candidatus Omnitrophota bacterium]